MGLLKQGVDSERQSDPQSGIAELVMFSLDACPPCDLLWSALQEQQFQGILRRRVRVSAKTSENKRMFEQFDLKRFPTLLLIKNGVEIRRMIGLPLGHDKNTLKLASMIADWMKGDEQQWFHSRDHL